jgi:hypothetical protein
MSTPQRYLLTFYDCYGSLPPPATLPVLSTRTVNSTSSPRVLVVIDTTAGHALPEDIASPYPPPSPTYPLPPPPLPRLPYSTTCTACASSIARRLRPTRAVRRSRDTTLSAKYLPSIASAPPPPCTNGVVTINGTFPLREPPPPPPLLPPPPREPRECSPRPPCPPRLPPPSR